MSDAVRGSAATAGPDASSPARPAQAWRQVGPGVAVVGAPALWIEAGADFRMMVLLTDGGGASLPLVGGAGRLALQAMEPDESAVLDVLRRRRGRLATAQVLCADGLVELHRAVCLLSGVAAPPLDACAIAAQARKAAAPEASRAAAMFCGLLGDAAGRAALTVGAHGGVFIGGALVPALGEGFARSPFRRRFEECAGDVRCARAIRTCVALDAAAGVERCGLDAVDRALAQAR